MPNPFEPLVPKSWISPIQEQLDERSLDQTPLDAQVKGFASGALEGLRGLTSPVDLAGMIPGMGIGAKAMRAAPRVGRMAGPALDLLGDSHVAQIAPAMDDVDALIGSMRHNLAKIPRAGAQPKPGPHMPAEFRLPPGQGQGAMEGLQKAVEDPYHAEMVSKYLRK